MPFTLPALPYPTDALEPHIDKMTMEIHHGKHHAAYSFALGAWRLRRYCLGPYSQEKTCNRRLTMRWTMELYVGRFVLRTANPAIASRLQSTRPCLSRRSAGRRRMGRVAEDVKRPEA